MNKVYLNNETVCPMTKKSLTKVVSNLGYQGDYDLSRLTTDLCDCHGEGEFVLLSLDDKSFTDKKAYMKCKNCNSFSHL